VAYGIDIHDLTLIDLFRIRFPHFVMQTLRGTARNSSGVDAARSQAKAFFPLSVEGRWKLKRTAKGPGK
jgi:hypothetical protein